MKLPLALLTKLLVLVSLILAWMPTGATETVCVVGSEKRIVAMRKCGMPCCARKPRPEPQKAACCKPKAAPHSELCGSAGLNCHCETRYVGSGAPGQVAVPKFSLNQLDLDLLDTSPRPAEMSLSVPVAEGPVIGTDVDPPRKVPRASMRGRAPPTTSV